ncbi:hypothetical protein TNCV_2739361 [Trichonephila clavipes]|nr:hypothetical protein TNCV_2739361 [Trichonephila clavipes]
MHVRACPKHARLDSGRESTLAIPYAVLFQLQACSPPDELYADRALSSWKTKESPMAPASVRPPMLITPHTIQPALLYCDLSRTNAGLFRVTPVPPYRNTSGVTL